LRAAPETLREFYSDAAGSFLLRGFGFLVRAAAFLRFKYAFRRLRFDRARCCWPTIFYMCEGLLAQARSASLRKSRIAFCGRHELNNSAVFSLPETFAPTQKTLIGGSILLVIVAIFFGALNLNKAKTLRLSATEAFVARDNAERARAAHEKELKAREAAISAEQAKLSEREGKTGPAEDQLAQILKEKAQLENNLQDKDAEIIALQKQLEEKQPGSTNPGAATNTELQAQLDDARQQLDAAEREKSLLSEKVQAVTERSAQLEDEKKRRAVVHRKIGVQGKVLAVNQAYNFVVLNLGGRNGVEPNSEMLIVREGTYIGKIRISSVEPATAIGDIMTSTLARGVQVQPGDIVIYADTNS
jgi:hypothetical protein